MSYQRKKKKEPLEIEADLFAAIATMDQLSKYFNQGYVQESLYKRQLKSTVSDVFKAQRALSDTGFDMDEFIEQENLREKYPEGLRRLNLAVGDSSDREQMSSSTHDVAKIVEDTANFVASTIELTDLLKLRSVATVEYIVPLLDDMYDILLDFPGIGEDYWSVREVNGWRKELLDENPSKLLDDERCEKLEFEASRWLSDFRKKTKEL